MRKLSSTGGRYVDPDTDGKSPASLPLRLAPANTEGR